MRFTTLLRRKIKYAETSQREVARQIGVSTTTVHYWCTNRARPNLQHLRQLEELLDCKPGELMVGCAYETPDYDTTF